MRVLCEGGGEGVEGEIVAGVWRDLEQTSFDWDCWFSVRCDDGDLVRVNGNVCDVEILEGSAEDLRGLWRVVFKAV